MKTSQQAGIDAKVLYDINQRIDTVTRALGMVDAQTRQMIGMLVQDMKGISLHLSFVLSFISEGTNKEEMKTKFDEFTKKYVEDQKKQDEAFSAMMKEKEAEAFAKEKEKGIIVI
jgi:hypothetical protein